MNSDSISWSMSHVSDLRWMISDQALDYSAYLCPPIQNREVFVESVREYLQYLASVDPLTPSIIVEKKLNDTMKHLDSNGENSPVLLRWLSALRDETGDIEMARETWLRALIFWSRNKDNVNFERMLLEFIRTFHEHVTPPWRKFLDVATVADREWLDSVKSRTEIDEFLYQNFFIESQVSPVMCFERSYYLQLQRIWWHENKQSLDQRMKDVLYQALVEIAYDGRSLNMSSRSVVILPLEEAFDSKKAEFLTQQKVLTS